MRIPQFEGINKNDDFSFQNMKTKKSIQQKWFLFIIDINIVFIQIYMIDFNEIKLVFSSFSLIVTQL